MTAVVEASSPIRHARFWAVTRAVAKRNLISILRTPSAFMPSLLFPFMFIVALTGAYSGVAKAPGFPTEKLVTWILPFTVLQSSMIVGMTTGLGLIRDIETRFYDRLLMAPINRAALIAGLYLAAMVRTLVPTTMVCVLGFAQGAALPGGVLGLVVLVISAEGACLAGAGWGIGMGLRLKSFKALPIMFMAVFLVTFMSSVQVPISFMEGWLKHVARWNPFTSLLNMARSGFLGDVTANAVMPGLIVAVAGALVLGTFAVRGLRSFD